MPVLLTYLTVKAGIHLPKYKGKYYAWSIAMGDFISQFHARSPCGARRHRA